MAGKALVSFVALEDRPRVRARARPLAVGADPQEPRGPAAAARAAQPFDAAITLSVARGGPRDTAIGFRWLVRDISAQRQLTDELRLREEAARREAEASEARARHVQKLESIGVLAGGIAHDFNNLLHVVLGNADLARLHSPADSAGPRAPRRGGPRHPARGRADPAAPGLLRPRRRREPAARPVRRGARDGDPAPHGHLASRPRSMWDLAPDLPPSPPTRPRCARS